MGRIVDGLRTWLGTHHLRHTRRQMLWSVAASVALALGALAGVAWIAGYDKLEPLLADADWSWVAAALGGEVVAYVGYTLAYQQVARVESDRRIGLRRHAALVANGFGAFIPRGGFAGDYQVLVESGLDDEEARRAVLGIGALEYAILAPAACVCAVFLLVDGSGVSGSFTYPWAIAVPVGFAVAFSLLAKRRGWHRREGWRASLARALDGVHHLKRLAARPFGGGLGAYGGMTLYWAGDFFALWACLRAFGVELPSLAALIVGYATGYALSRRTLPLAGAGVVELLLPFALHWLGAPLAQAFLGVLVYRVLNLWLPLAPAVVGHLHIRRAQRARSRRRFQESAALARRR